MPTEVKTRPKLTRPHHQLGFLPFGNYRKPMNSYFGTTKMADNPKVKNLALGSSVFFLCDMQEYFRPKIAYFPQILNVVQRMIKAANVLEIPVIATEHKGCGPTVPEIDIDTFKIQPYTKTTFSMLGCPDLKEELLRMHGIKSVVIFGVMADVCIYNTTLELLEMNCYDVHVVADGVSSFHNCERMICLERLRQSGAVISLSKPTLYNIVKSTDHPHYDVINKLVNNAPPDDGLVKACG